MPKVHEENGCRFYIFTNDHEPPHLHVRVGDGEIVINLDDTATVRSAANVKAKEMKKARTLVITHLEKLRLAWKNLHAPSE